mgnify:CR=1 FL=1
MQVLSLQEELKMQMELKKKRESEEKAREREEEAKLERRIQEQQERMKREFDEEQAKKKAKEQAVRSLKEFALNYPSGTRRSKNPQYLTVALHFSLTPIVLRSFKKLHSFCAPFLNSFYLRSFYVTL